MSSNDEVHMIGVISDTHGRLRAEALEALRGSDLILHAGDIGKKVILKTLGGIAPVIAVRGNMDRELWANELPRTEIVDIDGFLIYILHDLLTMDLNPRAAGFKMVISGHTHEPEIMERGGVLFVNPGSAGSKKQGIPLSLVKVELMGEKPTPEIVLLDG
jgi:putative phosphoesterase